jgi:phage baseplate assembly protein W
MSNLNVADFAMSQGDAAVNAQGGLFTASGMDNLIESLKRRLQTRVGALFYDPEYGNPALEMLSQPLTQDYSSRYAAQTRECLMQDRRVATSTVAVEIFPESRLVRCSIEIVESSGESGSFEEVSRLV